MYQFQKTYITSNLKMLDLVNENYSLLLFLQHFNIDFAVDNKSVKELCKENNIDLWAFITISNLYNGFYPQESEVLRIESIKSVLVFLKNSHDFYLAEKFPELKSYLQRLRQSGTGKDFLLIEKFFNDYFNEVVEHLDYEDKVAFPFFYELIEKRKLTGNHFSVNEYMNHHTDIETKLSDLKNLFLKHLIIKNELNTKRKFLTALFVLELDLKIHSVIEEKILIPLIEKIEVEINGKK